MEIYSIEIPDFAPATFHEKDGVWYHTQNPYHSKSLSQHIWNSTTKTIHRISDEITYTINCPLITCNESDFAGYVDHELIYIKESLKNSSEDLNIFICHSSLRKHPIYVGFFINKGVSETLW